MSKLPKIRIQYSWLLAYNASKHLNELWGEGRELQSDEFYEDIAKKYEQAWKPTEELILTAMCEILGLNFTENVIDVHIAPWFHAFSDPLVIGVIYKPDKFVDILTHELLHRLLTDNTVTPYNEGVLIPEWQKLFGKSKSFTTLAHIPVHAVHKEIYLDVLKDPKRYERDKADNKKHNATDYLISWDYVDKNGYKEIIEKLKKSYKSFSK